MEYDIMCGESVRRRQTRFYVRFRFRRVFIFIHLGLPIVHNFHKIHTSNIDPNIHTTSILQHILHLHLTRVNI